MTAFLAHGLYTVVGVIGRGGIAKPPEGRTKVTVFVRWPVVSKGKSSTDCIITGIDYFPGILEICGLPLMPETHLAGVSFAPVPKGVKTNENGLIYWHQTKSGPTGTGTEQFGNPHKEYEIESLSG